jgi:hypothetical protein
MRNVRAAFVLSLLLAASAPAATFKVTSTSDSGPGSLRQAITDANDSVNSTGAPATVAFSIGSGVQTIMPLTVLPDVAENVTVDGSTQPGYPGTPLIQLNDSLIALAPGEACLTSSGTIRGLAMNRCGGTALKVLRGRVTACFLGTDVTGRTALPNGTGLFVGAFAPVVIDGNVIAGNLRDLVITSAGAEISHNKIGTAADGESVLLFHPGAAISVEYTSDISIHDNVIGGHTMGIECLFSDRTWIYRNYIGFSPRSNSIRNTIGIHLSQSSFTQIGTSGANIIVGNTSAGIEIDGTSTRNTVRGNSISSNGGIGIDLSNSSSLDGVTQNDPGDGDTGPNLLQNYPILTNVTSFSGKTTISGTINSTPNQTILVDFYSNFACASSGYGEGQTYLFSSGVQTGADGNGSFTVAFPARLDQTDFVTATATDPSGNTSEFSSCASVKGVGVFVFSNTAFSTAEGGGSATITVRCLNSAGGAASVNYTTANGTAVAGNDYAATTGTLAFADGETSKTFTVPIINDAIYEAGESFTVALYGATDGAIVGSPEKATITIIDDDTPPTISIADARMDEGNKGSANMLFTVTLSGTITVPATVKYATSGTTASTGSDFQSSNGTVTFNPGETLKTISVPVFGDTDVEPDETFSISLLVPVNATIARGTASGTIVDDDGTGTITASNVRIAEGNSGTINAVITLTASKPFTGEVDFFTVDGTAKSHTDYLARTSFVTFNNETTKTITIPILGDTLPELDETFTVQLSTTEDFTKASSVIANPSSITVTIVNDDTGVGPERLAIPAGTKLPLAVILGSNTAQQVTFTSSNPAVATVPESVQVTGTKLVDVAGVAAGNTTITATLPPGFGPPVTIDVFVFDRANLSVMYSKYWLTVGDTTIVNVRFNPPLNVAETVTLSASGLGALAFPDRVTIDPGDTTAFTVKALTRGRVLLNLTLGSLHGNAVASYDFYIFDPSTTPAITQVWPNESRDVGGAAFALTGMNFRPDCAIRFDGVPASDVRFVSSSLMTARTPPHGIGYADLAVACGFDLFVRHYFFYFNTARKLTGIAPNVGSTSGRTFVKITGTNKYGGCWPFFDGIPARGLIQNGSELYVSTPAHAAAGKVPVTLRCSGSPDVSLDSGFTYSYEADPSAVITSVYPQFASPGARASISGQRFRLDDVVTFDGVPATFEFRSLEGGYLRIPYLPPGKASVTVTDFAGHQSTTGPIVTILDPTAPQIWSVTPDSVRPANEVTLTGSDFHSGYKFTIGGQPATILAMTDGSVRLLVPQVEAGFQSIKVVNAASSAVAALGPKLMVLPPGLAVTGASPACVTTDGGGRMTIYGSGFVPGAVVIVNYTYFFGSIVPDAAVTDAVVTDAQTITLTLPPLTPGNSVLTVINPNGDSASLSNALIVSSPFDPNGCTTRARPARH